MTKDQLKALPQSDFVRSTYRICCECDKGGKTRSSSGWRHPTAKMDREVIGVASYYICPSCYANHPEAPAARRYVVGKNSAGEPLLWCDGKCYLVDSNGLSEVVASHAKSFRAALASKEYDREVPEPAARAWAREHGHSDALFPGEDEAADVWSKWYIYESGINQEIHRRDKTEHTFLCYGRRWALAKWQAGDRWERFWSEYGEDAHEVTEPQARAYAAEHSIPWPPEWGEEGDGWEYGMNKNAAYRWRQGTDGSDYSILVGGGDTTWRVGSRGNAAACIRKTGGYRTCTLSEARSAIEAAGGTWPVTPDAPTRPSGELGEVEQPAWRYGRDSSDGMLYRWHYLDGLYDAMYKTAEWYDCGKGRSPSCCTQGDDLYSAITESQCIAFAREFGAKWADEMDPPINRKDATCTQPKSSPTSAHATSLDSGLLPHANAAAVGCGKAPRNRRADMAECGLEEAHMQPTESLGLSPAEASQATYRSCTNATGRDVSTQATFSSALQPTTQPTATASAGTSTREVGGTGTPSSPKATCTGCVASTPEDLRSANSPASIKSDKPMSAESSDASAGHMSRSPVGYSCRECGVMLSKADDGDWSNVACWCGGDAVQETYWRNGDPMPAWVQPGPMPGPWEDTHEWTGEYRDVNASEWFAGTNSEPVAARATRFVHSAPRHILRPLAQQEPGEQCGGCEHADREGLWMCEAQPQLGPTTFANPTNDCPHFTTKPSSVVTPDEREALSVESTYEGDPADCAFTGRESFLGVDAGAITGDATTTTPLADYWLDNITETPSGKDVPIMDKTEQMDDTIAITKSRWVNRVQCPRCTAKYAATDFRWEEDKLYLSCECGGTYWEMPAADSEPAFARQAAKWLALAPIRLPWAILKRIPRTIGLHYDDPHPGRLWATIQMVVGGTIISSIPGAWEFLGSHTEPLWMAPVEWAQAAWSSITSIDYGTIGSYIGPMALAMGGTYLVAKRMREGA